MGIFSIDISFMLSWGMLCIDRNRKIDILIFLKDEKLIQLKKFNVPIRFAFYRCMPMLQCFSLWSGTPKPVISNDVYKFTCQGDDELTYIGKTKRQF